MDKKALQKLENQCIQDQPPACAAACPLHVDARALAFHMGRKDWDAAWTLLRKTMPLPGILGRICDGPCVRHCRRGDAGEPIRVHFLERALVSLPSPPGKARPLPSRNRSVAVVGSGLSSLTAAWDLGRKGYQVRVFLSQDDPAAFLRAAHATLLPEKALTEELQGLSATGVTLQPGADLAPELFPFAFTEGCDALYLGLDAEPALALVLPGSPAFDPKTGVTAREGVFAGGISAEGGHSPVWQAAQGRWAATSIDRYLQKVSPSAGREGEGPQPTRLFTSLEGVPPLSSVPMADPGGYTPEEAAEEANRCLQCRCLECVKVCPYLERFGSYPRRYAREIYNNASIVMGTRQSNLLINSCSLCGLCQEICPEDFAMQDLCLDARRSMVERGKMPPSAHEFALLDMEFSRSDAFVLSRHQPGTSASAHLFFPGCQLAASMPEKVPPLYEILCRSLEGGVGIHLSCCAAPALWAGRENRFQEALDDLRETWASLGNPRLILACSTCLDTFRRHLPGLDFISLWQVLAQLPPEIRSAPCTGTVAVHDPCTTRNDPETRRAVRELLSRLNVGVEELVLGNEKTECCGFGGLMANANPDLAAEVLRRRGARSPLDFLTYCAMCRDALAGSGKRALHLADLILPDPDQPDPASRKRQTWSRRRDNRSGLKRTLLARVWAEPPAGAPDREEIVLEIPGDLRQVLDRRRILIQDLREVVRHAEASGEKLRHPGTGRFKAVKKVVNTLFWVEYSPSGGAFRIHNAYSHRMEVARS
jgi:NADPH-dependent glutamate synthase beta subunit-like oxidoreductase